MSSSLMRWVALPLGYIGTWRQGLVPSGRWPHTSARLNILRITLKARLASAGLCAIFFIAVATSGRFTS